MSEGPILSSRHCAHPDLNILYEFQAAEQKSGIIYSFDESLEETCDRVLESGSAFAFGDDGILGNVVLGTVLASDEQNITKHEDTHSLKFALQVFQLVCAIIRVLDIYVGHFQIAPGRLEDKIDQIRDGLRFVRLERFQPF